MDFFTLKKLEKLAERNQLLLNLAITKFDNEDGIDNLNALTSKKAYK